MAAAFLSAQIADVNATLTRLRAHVDRYRVAFEDVAESHFAQLPPRDDVARGTRSNGGIFYLLLPDAALCNALVHHLADAGVVAGGHYAPLHLEPEGRRLGGRPGMLPNVESLSGRLVRLPVFVGLDHAMQDHVIAATLAFFERR